VTLGTRERGVGPVQGRRRPSGVTLIELLVVLVLLGVIFAVSGIALASLGSPRASTRVRQLQAARAHAIRFGLPVLANEDSEIPGGNHSPLPIPALFLPDGRALGPGVDPLTGAPIVTR
jgi:prepilin-type N-terminal cleavage/methylation domain-containing protein